MGQSCFKRELITVLLSVYVATLTGCSTMDKMTFWKGAEAPKSAEMTDPALLPEHVKSSSIQELELKNAKLWTRVDELEDKVSKQRERLKILERGLMLGILPEELKGDGESTVTSMGKSKVKSGRILSDASAASVLQDEILRADAAEASAKAEKRATTKQAADGSIKESSTTARSGEAAHQDGEDAVEAEAVSKLSPKEQDEYQRLLGSAHDHYRAGRYGKAVVEFSEVGKVFGDLVEGGMHRYWIARSWIGLKEFQTARQQLTDFLRDFPASPWGPRAKLELARTEFQLGFKEKALQRLRDVIQTHPYEDAAEMAKMELSNLQKAL